MGRMVPVTLVCVAVLGVWAGRAAAQIPAADGTFYACVRLDRDGDEGRVARLVSASEKCRRNETRVSWNQKGQDGKPGLDGKPGDPGAPGTSVTVAGTFSGGEHACPNGGVILMDGTGTPSYLCNGQDAPAGTRAAGPCFDNTNRYVDCGNGTVTDTVTGLIWLKQADCLGSAPSWAAANQAAAALKSGDCTGLTDGSSPGDWRLPTKAEWYATIATAFDLGCRTGNGPSLMNDAGTACFGDGSTSSFAGVVPAIVSAFYWSSSTYEIFLIPSAYFVNLNDGYVLPNRRVTTYRVWPVRGGPR